MAEETGAVVAENAVDESNVYVNPQEFQVYLSDERGNTIQVNPIIAKGMYDGVFECEGGHWAQFHKNKGGSLVTLAEYKGTKDVADKREAANKVQTLNQHNAAVIARHEESKANDAKNREAGGLDGATGSVPPPPVNEAGTEADIGSGSDGDSTEAGTANDAATEGSSNSGSGSETANNDFNSAKPATEGAPPTNVGINAPPRATGGRQKRGSGK